MTAPIRQSELSNFDNCPLSCHFTRVYERGWSTAPQARGTVLHRVFAECLRECQRQAENTIPVEVAMAILADVLRKTDVHVPLSEMALIEMATIKFARDNTWSIQDVLAIERRLEATINCTRDGQTVTRSITGQPDVVIARPPDELVVVDFKSTWAMPADQDEDSRRPGVSYRGFFQLAFYALLLMRTYKSVNAVVLREMYVFRSISRSARIVRSDLGDIEHRLSILAERFDNAVESGPPASLNYEDLGLWQPSPGAHCSWCTQANRCPIDDSYTVPIKTPQDAENAAAARLVGRSVVKRMTEITKTWADVNGPIPIRHAKKNMVLGYRPDKAGRFEEFVLDRSEWPITIDTVDDARTSSEA